MSGALDPARLHSGTYRPEIDGLRAIAVTSVILCHAFPRWFQGGFVGVDVFFVISGYLISAIIFREVEAGNFSILRFYERRARRIFPALVAVLGTVLAFGWAILFNNEFRALGRHVVASSLFVENLLLWSESSYFDLDAKFKPLLHLWSLAIEEQFYIFWPLIVLGLYPRIRRFGLVLAGLIALSFAINLYDLGRGSAGAYYSPLGRSWELLVGAVLAYAQRRGNGGGSGPVLGLIPDGAKVWAGLALISGSIFLVDESRFPGWFAIPAVLGSLLVLASGGETFAARRILASKPFVFVGLISYPLYLWHWVTISGFNILAGRQLDKISAVVAIALAVGLATLTFLFIERPFRTAKGPVWHRRLKGLLGAMVATLALGAAVAFVPITSRLNFDFLSSRHEWSFMNERFGSGTLYSGAHLGTGGAARQVLVIGDSRIAQYVERFDQVLGETGLPVDLTLMIGGACVPIPGAFVDDPSRRACWAMRDRALAEAVSGPYGRVVIGGAWNWYLGDPQFYLREGDRKIPLNTDEGTELALSRLADLGRQVTAAGKEFTILLDNPSSPRFHAARKEVRLAWNPREQLTAEEVVPDARQAALHARMLAWAQANGLRYIDTYAAVCPGGACPTRDAKGQAIYKDVGHFSPDWARHNAGFIDPVVLGGGL